MFVVLFDVINVGPLVRLDAAIILKTFWQTPGFEVWAFLSTPQRSYPFLVNPRPFQVIAFRSLGQVSYL
jgi:hypothetical protein